MPTALQRCESLRTLRLGIESCWPTAVSHLRAPLMALDHDTCNGVPQHEITQTLGTGPTKRPDLRHLSKCLEGGHCTDATLCRCLLVVVYIHLDKCGLGELGGELCVYGGDLLARAAPGGREVDEYDAVVRRCLSEESIEGGLGCDVRHHRHVAAHRPTRRTLSRLTFTCHSPARLRSCCRFSWVCSCPLLCVCGSAVCAVPLSRIGLCRSARHAPRPHPHHHGGVACHVLHQPGIPTYTVRARCPRARSALQAMHGDDSLRRVRRHSHGLGTCTPTRDIPASARKHVRKQALEFLLGHTCRGYRAEVALRSAGRRGLDL